MVHQKLIYYNGSLNMDKMARIQMPIKKKKQQQNASYIYY